MQLWQMDVTASAFLADGREVKIITGIDDHSRYCVIARAVMRATARPVCQAFLDAMSTYGAPEEVLSDNGTVFTGRFIKPRPAEVLFERICRRNGIRQLLTKPYSPTTTGKVERWHQTLQVEFLNDAGPFASIEEAQAAVDAWREDYNHRRRTSPWIWPPRPTSSAHHQRATGWSCGRLPIWRPWPLRMQRLTLRSRHQNQRAGRTPSRSSGWSRRRGT